MIQTLLQVALGGALGASARYLTNVGVMRLVGPGFPVATMAVNILGSFVMGVLVVVLAAQGNRFAPLLMTGLLGGFTTFSAFSLDAVTLWNGGRPEAAALYVLGSVVVSLAALAVGLMVARGIVG
ncbi:fluoride efflux transporter CrcB [Frigidibacter sp. MR17.24]|uniref:fluoride efflux transporter CrcB n=1 Tax=Frigidibacter sp. MR17.24 TaxID=3127345 RepID=UPI003012A993